MGPVLHVCPDRETVELLTNASAVDSSRILAEHPCQPVVAVPTSITPADTSEASPPLTCLPAAVLRGQQVRCTMNWPSWEVLSWRFVPDPPTEGRRELPPVVERSNSREWAGPAGIGGVVTVFVRKGGEQQTFDTRFTVLDRASSWR
jgi:hypothetical protein